MVILFLILIILACIILSLIVLVQNPKGGGLSGSIAGFSTQFMGVKQTTDVLEKGTWVFAAIIALLCIASSMFIPGSRTQKTRTQPATEQTAPTQQPNGPLGAPAK